ncbi:hypothetical protein BGZ73_002637 [Actinomortierella ambigua]|nr:hypothetical protein BGZ73_002637 [Actinomortierella ambigua]
MPTIHNLFDIPEFASWTGRALAPRDLYQCVLVSKAWGYAFTPFLWSSFGFPTAIAAAMSLSSYPTEDHNPLSPFSPQFGVPNTELGLWSRFILGFSITMAESDFIDQILTKHGHHIRELSIVSTKALERYDTVGCCKKLRRLFCSLSYLESSSSRPVSPLAPLPPSVLHLQVVSRRRSSSSGEETKDPLVMIWRMVQASPRLQSLTVRGPAVLRPLDELQAFVTKQSKYLQRVDLVGAVMDAQFSSLAQCLPHVVHVRVDLESAETLVWLQQKTAIVPHPHLRVLVLCAPPTQGRVEVSLVRQLMTMFPHLEDLVLQLPHGYSLHVVQSRTAATSGSSNSSGSSGSGGIGHQESQLTVHVPYWLDADMAQLVLTVPRLKHLYGCELGPLTIRALVNHCRWHLESLEVDVMGGDTMLMDDSLAMADPVCLTPLLRSYHHRLKTVRCPEGVVHVDDFVHCMRWPCMWASLEYLECRVVGFPTLTQEEADLCCECEQQRLEEDRERGAVLSRHTLPLLQADQKTAATTATAAAAAALAKQRRRDECVQALADTLADIPFECALKTGQDQFSSILVKLRRQSWKDLKRCPRWTGSLFRW